METILNTKRAAIQFLAGEMYNNGMVQMDCLNLLNNTRVVANRAKNKGEIYVYENWLHTEKCSIVRIEAESGGYNYVVTTETEIEKLKRYAEEAEVERLKKHAEEAYKQWSRDYAKKGTQLELLLI